MTDRVERAVAVAMGQPIEIRRAILFEQGIECFRDAADTVGMWAVLFELGTKFGIDRADVEWIIDNALAASGYAPLTAESDEYDDLY